MFPGAFTFENLNEMVTFQILVLAALQVINANVNAPVNDSSAAIGNAINHVYRTVSHILIYHQATESSPVYIQVVLSLIMLLVMQSFLSH